MWGNFLQEVDHLIGSSRACVGLRLYVLDIDGKGIQFYE